MDDIKIYNYARSAAEIIADVGSAPAEELVAHWAFEEGSGS